MSFKEINNRIANLESMVTQLLEKHSGIVVQPPCLYLFHEWIDEWLKTYKAPCVKASTSYVHDVCVRVHIKPNMPNIPLNLIQGIDLQRFLTSIEKSRTRKTVHDLLNGCFREAHALKLIADNPMLAVKIPTHEYVKGKSLSREEVAELKKVCKGHRLEKLFLLYADCRRGEALGLTVADVDTKNKLLHIRGTKTKGSNRTIPLFQNVADLLPSIKPDKNGFYFKTDPRWVTRVFKRFCPAHKLHDLRHTFATNCMEAQIPLKVVQTWLGHSEISTTADIYSHVTAELNHAEAERFWQYQSKKDT